MFNCFRLQRFGGLGSPTTAVGNQAQSFFSAFCGARIRDADIDGPTGLPGDGEISPKGETENAQLNAADFGERVCRMLLIPTEEYSCSLPTLSPLTFSHWFCKKSRAHSVRHARVA
jgi:hypothetical protein